MSDAVNENAEKAGFLSRILVLLYGFGCYSAGLVALLWWIAAVVGLCPLGLVNFGYDTTMNWIINIGLIVLFGVQHTVMARSGFKDAITRIIPRAAERATYLLLTFAVLGAMVTYWQPLPGVVWATENTTLQYILWGVSAFGWAYVFAATFAIDHFDLMGLKQVYYYWRAEEQPETAFTTRFMYSFNRHPIQTGVLIGMWPTPFMTMDHFVVAVGVTIYIFIGLYYEERDLVRHFGEKYETYRKNVGGVIPWVSKSAEE